MKKTIQITKLKEWIYDNHFGKAKVICADDLLNWIKKIEK